MINLNKNKNDYPDNFFNQKKYKNLKVISFERKKGLLISFIIFKKFRKYNNSDLIIYFNNINSLWVIIGAKFAGIRNIAICIQNSIIGNLKENFKTIILIKIFNQLKVKLVPCSKAVLNSYLKIDKKIKFCNVIPNCIDVKDFQREVKMIKKNRKSNQLKNY